MNSPTPQSRMPYLAPLDALRAIAAVGIIITHVFFQSGIDQGVLGAIGARMDYWVPVFFALSGFLLWGKTPTRRYYSHRFARLAPAYLVYVAVTLLFVPAARTDSPPVILANLFMLQIYVPGALIGGLTHLWSLCVEVAFYIILPWLYVLSRGTKRGAYGVIIGLTVVSFLWPWVPTNLIINQQTLPMSYGVWFALGILMHQVRPTFTGRSPRFIGVTFAGAAVLALLIAFIFGHWGPQGLTHPSPWEFNLRVLGGLLFSATVFVPTLALARTDRDLPAVEGALVWAGKRGYSIFLWHLAVLSFMYPLLGIPLFSGQLSHALIVLAATIVVTLVVANLSYELVEKPGQEWLLRRKQEPKN
ncbi:MAG: acyltransferase [Corynebacterium sp.]|nr:acyltransferase [Corynebacterium sp.]